MAISPRTRRREGGDFRTLRALVSSGTAGIKLLVGGALGALVFATSATASDTAAWDNHAGTVLLRVHALGIFPENKSSSISAIGGKVDIPSRLAPEVDVSYFFSDHIAAQLIATLTRVPVTATRTALGNVPVGRVNALPPTLTVQYHFTPSGAFSPYLGAGITDLILYKSKPAGGAVNSVSFENNVGAALQAGFDYQLSPHWFLNAEIDQIFVKTRANIDHGAISARVDVNPFLFGVGVGYRF